MLRENQRPLTWLREPTLGSLNIKGAWESDAKGLDLPVAIAPTYMHPRMSAQLSRFTIHGKKKESLLDLIPKDDPPMLYKYIIDLDAIDTLKKELRWLGVRESSLKPDLDGLAVDLADSFLPPKAR